MAFTEVLLVYKKSQLQLALDKRNSRIQRLLKQNDPSVLALQASHDAHVGTLRDVEHAAKSAGVGVRRVYRARLRPAMVDGRLVISVGGDGTLLDASHKVGASPILGVNSDTRHSVGFLCCADRTTFPAVLADVLAGRLRPLKLRRLFGNVDGTPLPFPVLNDILITHKNPAATSKYLLQHGAQTEDHKSSGVWVATAAGSTAAIASAGGKVIPLDDARLQVVVREPFIADGAPYRLASFWLDRNDEVVVTSKMREGRVYLDGPHELVALPMGARLTLHGRGTPLSLIATPEMAQRRAAAARNHR